MITQPHNVSGCVGGTAMFTCVMRLQNVNISKEDIKWWRIANDHANNQKRLRIPTHGTIAFSITSNISGDTLTTILMINGLKSNFIGPYWLGMDGDTQLSDVAFLSITPNGTYVHIRIICILCTCVYTIQVHRCSCVVGIYVHMYGDIYVHMCVATTTNWTQVLYICI